MIRKLGLAVLAALALAACNQPAPKSADAIAAPSLSPSAGPVAAAPAPSAAPALPTEPAFLGAWADNAAACKLGDDDPDSPTYFTAKGYDQFEAHCDFEAVTQSGANEWSIKGRCATAINQNGAFKIKVEGDELTMSGDRGTLALLRCAKP